MKEVARRGQVVDRELGEAVTVPVYGSQAALVQGASDTTCGKRTLQPGAPGLSPLNLFPSPWVQ